MTESEKKWVVVFEPDYDRINEVIEGKLINTYYKIVESLVVKRNGFVLWVEKMDYKEVYFLLKKQLLPKL